MEFRYGSSFGVEPPEAYERLLLDCMLGDATLFTRGDEVEASWTLDLAHPPALGGQAAPATCIPTYAAGSWGPDEAERLLGADGQAWRRP